MKYHNNLTKGSQDIERTSSGLPTDIPTDIPTDRPTDRCKAICPSSSKGGISVSQTSLVHMRVGYEERKTPIDFEVNRSKVKVV